MNSWEMKVETPLPLTEFDNRRDYEGYDPSKSQCSFCGVGPLDPWYPVEDVSVVRHWTVDSVDVPGGGHWTWYCPKHLEHRAGNWWKFSHLAPAHLLPEVTHPCAHIEGAKTKCGEVAVEPFDGAWLCERHAAAERVNRRIAALLSNDGDNQAV
jgi:hypothetical protein